MSYNKLVRDSIPEIMERKGEIPLTRILSDEEYKLELERKLREELEEVMAASGTDRIEELADMLEVMMALARLEGKNLEDIISACDNKRKKRGAFVKKIYLSGVKK